MRILLAAGKDGLLVFRDRWQRLSCPLACPTQAAASDGQLIAADDAGLMWNGSGLLPVDSGLEALALWRRHALTLSGDTDSLTLLDVDTGQPQWLTPAGMYPQDLCLLPGDVIAVCGGADGLLRLIRLSDLRTIRTISLPGFPQRVACSGNELTALCLMGDAELHTLMVRCSLTDGSIHPACTMPGLPGALCPDGRGGVWMAVTERLAHFPPRENAPDVLLSGFGLIRHMQRWGGSVLVSDPVLGECALVGPFSQRRTLYEGDVRQAVITE